MKNRIIYNTAILLKDFGFDKPCKFFHCRESIIDDFGLGNIIQEPTEKILKYHAGQNSIHCGDKWKIGYSGENTEFVKVNRDATAPLLSEVQDWFRDVHFLHIKVEPVSIIVDNIIAWYYTVYETKTGNKWVTIGGNYEYYETYEKCIDSAIEDIIKTFNHLDKEHKEHEEKG